MILVTGAGGTVGSAVASALGEAKVGFRAAYHSKDKADKARAAGQDVVLLDFAKPETMRPALAGVERLFLLGATTPDQAEREIAVVRAAKEAGVGHVVKLSVWEAPKEAYAFARVHRRVEGEIERSAWPSPSCGRTASCRTPRATWQRRSRRRAPSTSPSATRASAPWTCATSRRWRSRP